MKPCSRAELLSHVYHTDYWPTDRPHIWWRVKDQQLKTKSWPHDHSSFKGESYKVSTCYCNLLHRILGSELITGKIQKKKTVVFEQSRRISWKVLKKTKSSKIFVNYLLNIVYTQLLDDYDNVSLSITNLPIHQFMVLFNLTINS